MLHKLKKVVAAPKEPSFGTRKEKRSVHFDAPADTVDFQAKLKQVNVMDKPQGGGNTHHPQPLFSLQKKRVATMSTKVPSLEQRGDLGVSVIPLPMSLTHYNEFPKNYARVSLS